MRAITLRPHLAIMVVLGLKWIETRSWRTGQSGAVAIHASSSITQAERRLCLDRPFYLPLRDAGYWRARDDQPNLVDLQLPLGSIVGVVNVCKKPKGRIGRRADGEITIEGYETPPPADQVELGDFTPGRFAWTFSNPTRLAKPIPCKGKLGIWQLPPEIAAEVREGGPKWW